MNYFIHNSYNTLFAVPDYNITKYTEKNIEGDGGGWSEGTV